MKPERKEKLLELLNESCPGDCKDCPFSEIDVMKHGDYEYDCLLEAVIDIIKTTIQ